MWAAVISAGITSIFAAALPHKLGLMVAALIGVSVGVIYENLQADQSILSKQSGKHGGTQ